MFAFKRHKVFPGLHCTPENYTRFIHVMTLTLRKLGAEIYAASGGRHTSKSLSNVRKSTTDYYGCSCLCVE